MDRRYQVNSPCDPEHEPFEPRGQPDHDEPSLGKDKRSQGSIWRNYIAIRLLERHVQQTRNFISLNNMHAVPLH